MLPPNSFLFSYFILTSKADCTETFGGKCINTFYWCHMITFNNFCFMVILFVIFRFQHSKTIVNTLKTCFNTYQLSKIRIKININQNFEMCHLILVKIGLKIVGFLACAHCKCDAFTAEIGLEIQLNLLLWRSVVASHGQ